MGKDLVNVKKKDAVGRQAEFYLRKKGELKGSKEAFEKSEGELVAALKTSHRNSIVIDGVTLSINHVDSKDKIKAERTNKGSGRKSRR